MDRQQNMEQMLILSKKTAKALKGKLVEAKARIKKQELELEAERERADVAERDAKARSSRPTAPIASVARTKVPYSIVFASLEVTRHSRICTSKSAY